MFHKKKATGRATCKKCRMKILVGTDEVVMAEPERKYIWLKHFHIDCFRELVDDELGVK